MTEIIQKKLSDSAAARWTALVLVASMMFFGYMFVDVMSPLQSLIEQDRGWSPDVFGTYAAIAGRLMYDFTDDVAAALREEFDE